MKPCVECGGSKYVEDGAVWERHRKGCSWSPMVPPAATVLDGRIGIWRMRTVEQASEVPEGGTQK